MCAALMNSARADVFRVEIQSAVTANSGFPGITVLPPLPFAVSFYINDAAKSCAPNCVTPITTAGGVVYSYSTLTISGFPTITIGQVIFPPNPSDGQQGGAILSNQIISNGSAPLISTRLVDTTGVYGLEINVAVFPLFVGGIQGSQFGFATGGPVAVRVIGFAGTPGSSQCHGQSVSTLAHKYGGMAKAAIALKYASVAALQADITLFCGS
jgi:hypothetical protein